VVWLVPGDPPADVTPYAPEQLWEHARPASRRAAAPRHAPAGTPPPRPPPAAGVRAGAIGRDRTWSCPPQAPGSAQPGGQLA
jgi:hypothetical protein